MFNLPNTITLVRIALVVVMTIALAVGGYAPGAFAESTSCEGWFVPIHAASCVALWAFVMGAVSDFLDGYLARKYNSVTNFGKLIDPLADKILVSAAFIYLTYVGLCPFWVTIIILFREFMVTGLRQLAVANGLVIAANSWGKWKTAIQLAFCIACFCYLAYGPNLPEPLHTLSVGEGGELCRSSLLWGSLVLTVWSGAVYTWQCRSLLK